MSEQHERTTALESDEAVEDTALGDAGKKDEDAGFIESGADI